MLMQFLIYVCNRNKNKHLIWKTLRLVHLEEHFDELVQERIDSIASVLSFLH